MAAAIILKHLSKSFPDSRGRKAPVLVDINLEIQDGEIFMLLGPSGCGKSTILRIMSGLEKDFTGERKLVPDIKPADFSFVFQQFALFPWLTVYENVALGLVARGLPLAQQKKIVAQELALFGLTKFAHTRPKDLSGGMRQRVGLARALAISPKIIFLDEPFSELDSFTAEELRQELTSICQQRKLIVVMVTHLIEEAIELGDRIAVMSPRPAKIEKIISNKIPRPRNRRAPEFFRLEDELYKLIKP